MNFFAIGTLGADIHYGFGDTADEAIHDAMYDLRQDGPTQALDVVETYPCTDVLRAQDMIVGRVDDYCIRDGRAYTNAQAAAVDAGLKVDDDGLAWGEFQITEADAVRLGMRTDLDVWFRGAHMNVEYSTSAGRSRSIHKDPLPFEHQGYSYERHLLDIYGAVIGFLEVAAKRDAEAEAEAS